MDASRRYQSASTVRENVGEVEGVTMRRAESAVSDESEDDSMLYAH